MDRILELICQSLKNDDGLFAEIIKAIALADQYANYRKEREDAAYQRLLAKHAPAEA
jgi:hypothetical protein